MMCGVHERAPHPLLRGAVLRYAGYEERAAAPVRRTELPQDRVSLILNLGGPFEVEGRRFGSFVAPVDDRPAVTGFEASARGVQVDLTPFAARALLGVPLDALGGALAVDLGDVLGREAAELEERLDAAPGWEARFALLDALLVPRLAGAPAPPPDAARAWARLQATAGGVRIGALAGELGCSRRHLTARFREHVGVPPKTVARHPPVPRARSRSCAVAPASPRPRTTADSPTSRTSTASSARSPAPRRSHSSKTGRRPRRSVGGMPRTVYPILQYRDPRAAIDWLQRAFGLEPAVVHESPDGEIGHAELRCGEHRVMLVRRRVRRRRATPVRAGATSSSPTPTRTTPGRSPPEPRS